MYNVTGLKTQEINAETVNEWKEMDQKLELISKEEREVIAVPTGNPQSWCLPRNRILSLTVRFVAWKRLEPRKRNWMLAQESKRYKLCLILYCLITNMHHFMSL